MKMSAVSGSLAYDPTRVGLKHKVVSPDSSVDQWRPSGSTDCRRLTFQLFRRTSDNIAMNIRFDMS